MLWRLGKRKATKIKVIIAGSRTLSDYTVLTKAIEDSGFNITEVVCSGAKGIDELAKQYGAANNIKVTAFYPNWGKYGKEGGERRSIQMTAYADAMIMVWNGKSPGNKQLLELANKNNLKIFLRLEHE